MNDFTKEELEKIMDVMFPWLPAPDHLVKIYIKIKSLIENYCEHEFMTSNEVHFKCISCGMREP